MTHTLEIRKAIAEGLHPETALRGLTVAIYDSATDELTYMASDHLTSANLILDDTGLLLSQQRYMPEHSPSVYVMEFAKQTPRHKTSAVAGYTGQRNYGDFGLMDYNARFYSPSLGRFVQPDTIIPSLGNSQAWDRYSYVYNNPIRNNDPSGHLTKEQIEEWVGEGSWDFLHENYPHYFLEFLLKIRFDDHLYYWDSEEHVHMVGFATLKDNHLKIGRDSIWTLLEKSNEIQGFYILRRGGGELINNVVYNSGFENPYCFEGETVEEGEKIIDIGLKEIVTTDESKQFLLASARSLSVSAVTGALGGPILGVAVGLAVLAGEIYGPLEIPPGWQAGDTLLTYAYYHIEKEIIVRQVVIIRNGEVIDISYVK